MGDLLSTGVSGLLAFQQALDVTSNNIANSSTPGYSLENIELTPGPAQPTGGGYLGTGVEVEGITRSYSELLAQQVRSSQASYSSYNTLATQAGQIDNMLSSSSTGLTTSIQSFVSALQTLTTDPSSTASRQALLSQAQALAQQINSYSSQIQTYGSDLEQQIGTDVTQVNSISSGIAKLNTQIAADLAGGQTPNELMDQRDNLLDQLSQYVTVSTSTESDGSMDVYVGSGQAIVTGGASQQLTTVPNQYNPTVSDIGVTSAGGTTDITSEINGGELGGLIASRSQVLNPAQNALGLVSVGLATIMNQSQASGMDLTGAQGQPMFSVGAVQVEPSSNNTGAATVGVTRSNLSALTADDYQLSYQGGAWQLKDVTSGQSVTMTGAGTVASPFQAAGVSIVVGGGAPVNGDSYLIQPTEAAPAGLALLLTNPNQIAAASLAQTAASASNTGSGVISAATITTPSSWVPDTYTLSFLSPSQYQVTNSAGTVVVPATAYTAGQPISFEGAEVTLTGAPATGDTFTISSSTSADSGDNSNALAMISALSANTLAGGTTSLTSVANNLVTQVGVTTQAAQANASAQQSVNQDATTARSNLSGVNLDAEAAQMLQYQQAYQAMAQVIQASGQMFTSLMTAITDG
ncbi:MAG TPA: flagellar hook-associated protein FlgK [Steroidobacteraceae bacterium]|jgi:flagellar hook-associated protein 1 FlgK|nr:flagellar hook-associated protein FlgK [Steroidobacteraceae bacterium]